VLVGEVDGIVDRAGRLGTELHYGPADLRLRLGGVVNDTDAAGREGDGARSPE
jgi:hypothetical protein